MSETPVRYGKHTQSPPRDCEGCGMPLQKPLTDHCHDHGWVRGIVCGSCNIRLGYIDRRLTSAQPQEQLLASLIAIRNRCPDCEPISRADLVQIEVPARFNSPEDLTEDVIQALIVSGHYLSQADITWFLGLDRTIVNVWRKRYADFPEPDMEVGMDKPVPGWRPDRLGEITAWMAARGLGRASEDAADAPAA